MRSYWRRAARQALSDTLDFLGLTVRSRLQFTGAAFSYILALLLFLWIAGQGQMVAELQWGVALVGALLLIFIPVFLANLIAAPVRLEREASKERTHLRGILRVKTTHKEVQQRKADLSAEGFELVRETFEATDLDPQRQKISDWKLRAGNFISEHIGPAERVQFDARFSHGQTAVTYNGKGYTGDAAVLAHGLDFAAAYLNGVYVAEDYYSDFLTEQWEKELAGK
jgi:hypothetical protein